MQRAPDLLFAIKREVDRDRRPGRFLLTGSANLLLMKTVGELLAGRAIYLVLRPLSEREKRGASTAPFSGAHLEALVLNDLLVWRELLSPKPAVFHYQSAGGEEIDFIVERGKRLCQSRSKQALRFVLPMHAPSTHFAPTAACLSG